MDKISLYIKESYHELLNKVTWPTWGALQNTSVVVVVASLIMTLFVFLMDLASKGLMDIIYGI